MKRLLLSLSAVALIFPVRPAAAHAVTVLTTTQGDVKKQCAGHTECTTACGGTLCDYVCKDPKTQCTVTVFRKGQTLPGGRRPVVSGVKTR